MVECSRCSSRPTMLCPRRSRWSYPSFQPGFKNCVEDFFILLLCCIPTLRGNSLLHIPFIVKTLQCNVIAHSWSPSWETYPPIWPMLFPTQILLEYLDQPLQSGLSTRESPSKSPSPYSMTPLLKGSFTIFLFLVRSYILNSNGVWYSWFWLEGPINAQNSIFGGFKFAPRDLDSQRHMGPRLAAQGTLTRSAGDLDSQRHGKLMALRVKVPCGAASRGPWGQT